VIELTNVKAGASVTVTPRATCELSAIPGHIEEFEVYFSPKIDPRRATIVGFEEVDEVLNY
jgi:hypothetical protein